ncbi:serine/threonine protein kinase [Planctomicrobium piriforme]|uniref:non-specific serine/threonine protein kinase n=1 Tax=Planctomicrobium piriforme TaxID=1576369 RepID=A0A1I3CJ31_9PLAN|nr:serine/threonine-protein kinase [Planctomicrobium piriforme]SFH74465.1 Serine/threonine protein kinase [Planctomicrobium piriforme]
MPNAEREKQSSSPHVSDDTSTLGAEKPNIDRTLVDGDTPLPAAPAWPAVGANLGKYEIRQLLGRGGMGAVFLGFDTILEREVAIKVLPPEIEARPNTLNRFLAEAKATGKLNHPHVVAIYDLGQSNGLYYFVMEVLRGGSVADLIENRGALPWRDACRMIAQAADGLAAAHAVGLVHRDIKPENLMFNADGLVKVVDFGVSKLVDEEASLHMTAAGQLLGTPHYMSPEQVRATEIDARSDIYNLGATLYRLITGRYPYEDCKAITQVLFAHLEQPAPTATAHRADVHAGCDEVITRAMAKKPEARYQSAAEFASALRALSNLAASIPAPAVVTSKAAKEDAAVPLRSVAILEPSKMQAMVLQNSCKKAGVQAIRTLASAASALAELEKSPPDVLITAQQLPDGTGLELLQRLRRLPSLQALPVVLTSNDLQIDDAIGVNGSGWLGVAAKSARPDQILRGLHAATSLTAATPPFSTNVDLTAVRLLLLSDSQRVPEPIAALFRELRIFDVQVAELRAPPGEPLLAGEFDLALALSANFADRAGAAQFAASVLSGGRCNACIVAVAAAAGNGEFRLQAVNRPGFASVTDCPLNPFRLMRLLQSVSQ